MKKNLQDQLVTSLRKLNNLYKSCKEIEDKIENLSAHVANIEKAIDDEETHIRLLGCKQPSRDLLHPDTEESRKFKNEFNEKLQTEKAAFIDEAVDRNDYSALKSYSTIKDLLKIAEGN